MLPRPPTCRTVTIPTPAFVAKSSWLQSSRPRAALTDVREILEAIIRSALADEALAKGLKCRISEMQDRLTRLQDRASKRRGIVKDVMSDLDIKKIEAADFTVSIRPGLPALTVLNEDEVPSLYWTPGEPRLNRQYLARDLKDGAEITGATLGESEPVLSVRVR